MFRKIKAGTTSLMLPIFVRDSSSSTGAGLSLAYNAAGLIGEYRRIGQSSWTTITLATATLGTFTSGGWVADGSDTGSYEVGIPNAAIASGATGVVIRFRGATNMLPVRIFLELDAVDYQDGIAFGLTSIPGVPHSGSGGLLTVGTGGGQLNPSLGSVNVASGSQTAIAGKVWDEARSGHTTSGTFGAYVLANTASDAAIAPASTALSTATWTGTRAGYLDNLSAGAVATASALSTAAGNITTILGQTGTTGVVIASGAITASTIASDAITAAKIATGAITSAKFAAGAIDAAAIATGAIDADALAADAVTEIWAVAVPGSFSSGSAAYVLGNIATGTPPTAAAIADAVWDEARTGHTTSGTFGYYLDSAISGVSGGGGATAADIADAVWDELISGHATSGSFAAAVTTDQTSLSTLLTRLSSTRAGYLDNLSGGAVALASALTSAAADVTTILGQTGTTGVVVASGSKSGYSLATAPPTAAANATAVLTTQMTESYAADGTAPTLAQAIFLIQQALTEFSISGTTITAKKLDGSTTAATFTLDSSTSPTSRTRSS